MVMSAGTTGSNNNIAVNFSNSVSGPTTNNITISAPALYSTSVSIPN